MIHYPSDPYKTWRITSRTLMNPRTFFYEAWEPPKYSYNSSTTLWTSVRISSKICGTTNFIKSVKNCLGRGGHRTPTLTQKSLLKNTLQPTEESPQWSQKPPPGTPQRTKNTSSPLKGLWDFHKNSRCSFKNHITHVLSSIPKTSWMTAGSPSRAHVGHRNPVLHHNSWGIKTIKK